MTSVQWSTVLAVRAAHSGQPPSLLQRASVWMLYVAFPHLNYFDLTTPVVHQWNAVAWITLAPVVLYGLGWTLVLLVLAVMRFNRCDL